MTDWPTVHENTTLPPAMIPLAALSYLYGLAVRIRVSAYGKRKKRELPGFVLSIGNLTVGGTGKTPAAAMIAEWALKEGYRPAILSRGYGSRHRGKTFEVSDGEHILCTPAEAGDEPYLLAKNLPHVPVILSKTRYEAGLLANKRHASNFFILDDGFQHLVLKKDLDLVLLDATSPFGNMHLLPRGPLREPVGHLKRADAFVLTRSGSGTNLLILNYLKKKFGGKPAFRSEHVPERLVVPKFNKTRDPDFIRGKRVVAFAGIAKPETFRKMLIELGAEIIHFRSFQDHHFFRASEFQDLVAEGRKHRVDLLLTTEKDFVRLGRLSLAEDRIAFLTIRFRILSGAEGFFGLIRGKVKESCLT